MKLRKHLHKPKLVRSRKESTELEDRNKIRTSGNVISRQDEVGKTQKERWSEGKLSSSGGKN